MSKHRIYIRDFTFTAQGQTGYANQLVHPVPHTASYLEWNLNKPPTGEWLILTELEVCKSFPNNKTVAWLLEPRCMGMHPYLFLEKNINLHNQIWTFDRNLLDLGHAHIKFCTSGASWIPAYHHGLHKKTKICSAIASFKRFAPGHFLRHEAIKILGASIDAFGDEYIKLSHRLNKIQALKDYMYTIVVENSKMDYYFTEKLIDALSTGTIPIYWGCPSISKFFNTDGFIIFDKVEELPEILERCTPELYESKLPAIQENFERAKEYFVLEDWIAKNLISHLN